MKPSDELIEKFRQIFIKEYGEDMSFQEAYDNFTSLVDLLRIISQLAQTPTKSGPNKS